MRVSKVGVIPIMLLSFVLPYVLVYLPVWPEWFARMLGTGWLLLNVGGFAVLMVLDLQSPMVRESSKLARLNAHTTRRIIEWGLRGFLLVIGIGSLFFFSQWAKEALAFRLGSPPPEVRVEVTSVSTALLSGFAYQSFELKESNGNKIACRMAYSLPQFVAGKHYLVRMLPKTHWVLAARQL